MGVQRLEDCAEQLGIQGDPDSHGLAYELFHYQPRMTHEEIGELVGSSRETIARILSDFRRKGLIEIEGRSITIPDRNKLEALLL